MSVHFTVQGQDESDVIFSAFEQTLKTVVPRVGKMSEEQLTEHLLYTTLPLSKVHRHLLCLPLDSTLVATLLLCRRLNSGH